MTFRLCQCRPVGSLFKAAKNCFILLNGSVALIFVTGQPQRTDFVVPLISGIAAFKKRPRGPDR